MHELLTRVQIFQNSSNDEEKKFNFILFTPRYSFNKYILSFSFDAITPFKVPSSVGQRVSVMITRFPFAKY